MRRVIFIVLPLLIVGSLAAMRPTGATDRHRPVARPAPSIEPLLVSSERAALRTSRYLVARATAPTAPVKPKPKPKPKPVVKPKPKPKPVVRTVVHTAPRVAVPTSAVKRYAYALLGAAQYACLASIISKEDYNWDPLKSNYGGSGAYGIPQALPGSKMASAGADWRTNGKTQIRWMVGYVDSRYGSACGAWAYWQVHKSY